ncbi:MAG: GAF domain-containing protein [Actinomycetota bacterium]|nr:GAF domain-containing protein [Actinomycetota bacterium]
MSWISDAIRACKQDIISELSTLISEQKDALSIPPEEVMKEAEFTLGHLVSALSDGKDEELLERWESLGRKFSEENLSIVEIPNTLDFLKRATWRAMEKKVEKKEVAPPDLVDAMMVVESILSECWFVMVRSYFDSCDINATASTDKSRAFYELAEILSDETNTSKMYEEMVKKATNIAGVKRCALFLFDQEKKPKLAASNTSILKEALEEISDMESEALAAVVSLGGPVSLEKEKKNPPEIEMFLDRCKTLSVLLVPLKMGERELGMLLLDDGEKREFTPEQMEIAVAVANHISIAVDKSDLLVEMEKRLEYMAAIGIVAKMVSSYLNPKEQLETILEMAAALMQADSGFIMLKEEMFGELKIEAKKGSIETFGDQKDIERVSEWVMENRKCISLHKGTKDYHFPDLEISCEACVFAPLVVGEKVLGGLGVASGKAGVEYSSEETEMLSSFSLQAAVSIENARLYQRLEDSYIGTIASLVTAMEARDPYTTGHSARVTKYAVAIAHELGLTPDEIDDIRLAGMLHDLGKIGIPDNVLKKPGRLTEDEYSAIKMHPALSVKILESLPQLGNIIPLIYHHHERYDGGGYMNGKSGEEIPLGARILAVADSYEAMTSDRPYRKALSKEEAVAEIKRNSGSQFDSKVAEAFLRLLEKAEA